MPLLPFRPAEPAPRLTLRAVLYAKFLRWIADSSGRQLVRAFLRLLGCAGIAAAVFAPQYALGTLYGALQWHQYGLLKFGAAIGAIAYAATAIRMLKRLRVRRQGANQHTFEGLPVDELATFLIERQAFKRDDAMKHFGISQQKHDRISQILEKTDVLVRGEKNARILNVITREQLVRQLRDKFPLRFRDNEWCENTDSFQRWIVDKDRSEAKEAQKADRLERKVERLEKRREDLQKQPTVFEQLMRPVA